MFPEMGKQVNIDGKHNVSTTMFSSMPRASKASALMYVDKRMSDEFSDAGNAISTFKNLLLDYIHQKKKMEKIRCSPALKHKHV